MGQAAPATNRPVRPPAAPLPPICAKGELTPEHFSRLLSQRLSALAGREASGIPATFLSVDAKDGSATVAQSLVTSSGEVLTFSARGATNDGVLAVFGGGVVSPSFGGAVEFHKLAGARRSLQYDGDFCDTVEEQRMKLEQAYLLRYREDSLHAERSRRALARIALAGKRNTLESALAPLLAKDRATLPPAEQLRIDSLLVARVRLDNERLMLDSLILSEGVDEQLSARNARNDGYAALLSQTPVLGFSFGWWSAALSVDKSRFTLLDPLLAPADQLQKKDFLTRSLQLSYSWIRQDALHYRTGFLTVAARAGVEHSLDRLTKADVTDRVPVSPANPDRVIEKKTTAYSGAYERDLAAARVSLDYYRYFIADDRVAFHVFPAWMAREGELSRLSLGTGLLLSGYDATKKRSRVNAEFLMSVPNLVGGRAARPLAKTLTGGIRVTFPFGITPF